MFESTSEHGPFRQHFNILARAKKIKSGANALQQQQQHDMRLCVFQYADKPHQNIYRLLRFRFQIVSRGTLKKLAAAGGGSSSITALYESAASSAGVAFKLLKIKMINLHDLVDVLTQETTNPALHMSLAYSTAQSNSTHRFSIHIHSESTYSVFPYFICDPKCDAAYSITNDAAPASGFLALSEEKAFGLYQPALRKKGDVQTYAPPIVTKVVAAPLPSTLRKKQKVAAAEQGEQLLLDSKRELHAAVRKLAVEHAVDAETCMRLVQDAYNTKAPHVPTTKAPEPEPESTCVVCLCNPSTHILIPCGHICLCESCAMAPQTQQQCFVCRQEVNLITKVFRG